MSYKRLLIIDDSEIDRVTLKNILSKDFDIVEADNGYFGLEVILSGTPHIDGVLLDIFMPVLDGFNVLRLMKENGIENLPVILVTANATKPNVEKAIFYKVTDFIIKPFNAKTILERLRPMFQIDKSSSIIIPRHTFSENDIAETNTYITKLQKLYEEYLKNNNADDGHYVRTAGITEILLTEYASSEENCELDSSHIGIISKAVYFMDIGYMLVPDDYVKHKNNSTGARAVYESHTVSGAGIVRLNSSPSCQYFVRVCSDICMHHHERYDGRGYPHGMNGQDNAVYVQICTIAARFDELFSKRKEINDYQFDFIIKEMKSASGAFNPRLLAMLSECQFSIISYYKKYSNGKRGQGIGGR